MVQRNIILTRFSRIEGHRSLQLAETDSNGVYFVAVFLFVNGLEYIHKSGFTYITLLLLLTYTDYFYPTLSDCTSSLSNPKGSETERNRNKDCVHVSTKRAWFCFFRRQYTTNRTSIDNSFSSHFPFSFNATCATCRWFSSAIGSCEASALFPDFLPPPESLPSLDQRYRNRRLRFHR